MNLTSFFLAIAITIVNLSAEGSALKCSQLFRSEMFDRNIQIQNTDPLKIKDELEKLSIEVMRQIAQKKQNHKANVLGWLDSLSENQDIQPLNVLEHTSLLYIYKSGILDSQENPEILRSLERAIEKSYTQLSGKKSKGTDYLSPLPATALRNQAFSSELAVLFHESVFAEATSQNKLNQSASSVNLARTVLRKVAIRANWSRFFQTLFAVAAVSTSAGRGVFAGAILGLIEASINEYMIQIGVGHATPKLKKFFRYLGPAGNFAQDIILAHSIHHALVKDDFGVAVPSPEVGVKAEKIVAVAARSHLIERMIYEKYPKISDEALISAKEQLQNAVVSDPSFEARLEKLKGNLRNGNFGVNGTWKGAASMLVTATPFYLLNIGLYQASGNTAFLVSSTVSLSVMILQSLYSHRYLHLSPPDRAANKTTAKTD